MSAFLTDIGSVVTMLLGKFTDVLGLFTSQPVLTVIFGIFVTGAVIGLVTRLYRHA
jgi:uncharacterized membrane protein